jgi:hypothetical protein
MSGRLFVQTGDERLKARPRDPTRGEAVAEGRADRLPRGPTRGEAVAEGAPTGYRALKARHPRALTSCTHGQRPRPSPLDRSR